MQEITATGKSKNVKVTAGVQNACGTEMMTAKGKLPWYIKTNIKPVVFVLKNQTMAIMPDRLLIFGKKDFGVVSYQDAQFDLSAIGFVERGKVPKDAETVKYVWAYANKDGSADKRYSNNKQYPVMKYGKVVITSKNGLNIQFMCSNEDALDRLEKILKHDE